MPYAVSFTPAVSKLECMASCARPKSAACTLTCTFERFPSVEPPAESLLFANVCTGTPARAHTSFSTARLNASVV